MTDFVRFSASATPVKLQGVAGLLNGYKINEVTHGGRNVSLRNQNYYYIPATKSVVTYRASTARVMTINAQRKFNFRETLQGGYGKTVNVDASMLYSAAADRFN